MLWITKPRRFTTITKREVREAGSRDLRGWQFRRASRFSCFVTFAMFRDFVIQTALPHSNQPQLDPPHLLQIELI